MAVVVIVVVWYWVALSRSLCLSADIFRMLSIAGMRSVAKSDTY